MGSLPFSLPLSLSPLTLSPTLWVIYEHTLPLLVLLASVEKEKEGLVSLEFMSRFKDISYFFYLLCSLRVYSGQDEKEGYPEMGTGAWLQLIG